MTQTNRSNHKHKYEPQYEDHIFMGQIYYGSVCKCGARKPELPGPLELGTYK